MITEQFVGRLEKILSYYELSASSFADKINVQRSSISHLLSGRNKPSLEFVLKVVSCFPEVNLYWLLNGKGSFPNNEAPTLSTKANTSIAKIPITDKTIQKIIVFYTDGTFEPYTPAEPK